MLVDFVFPAEQIAPVIVVATATAGALSYRGSGKDATNLVDALATVPAITPLIPYS